MEVYGKDITESSLIPNFQTLLKDDENEVKIAAINSLSQFIKSLSAEKIANLIPPIQALAKDQNDQVRGIKINHILASNDYLCNMNSPHNRCHCGDRQNQQGSLLPEVDG